MKISSNIRVRVQSITYQAENILAYEFVPVDEPSLPAFEAGSHIDLIIKDTPLRSYSLFNDPQETHRYCVAIARVENGRGGSKRIHQNLICGSIIEISPPRNNFPLYEGDATSILIAGGIGITPMYAMVQRLEQTQAPWHLHYFCRSRETAAFFDLVTAGFRYGQVDVHIATPVEEVGQRLGTIFAADEPQNHYYCCGPAGMLEAYLAAAGQVAAERVHYETFAPLQEVNKQGGFEVLLEKSGKTLLVEPGQTILEACDLAGVQVMNSCREGICGACEVRVLEGVPEHCDSILSEQERSSNKTMFICCSGSKTPRLVLDI